MVDGEVRFDPTKSQKLYQRGPVIDYIEIGVSYRLYPGMNVANYHGAELMGLPNTVRKIKVFAAPHYFWQENQTQSNANNDPKGNGNIAPSGWRFPGRKQFGLVMFQPSGKMIDIGFTSPTPDNRPIELADMSGGNGVYFAVNNLDNELMYARHAGTVTLLVAETFP
jgi:hypothetical protein